MSATTLPARSIGSTITDLFTEQRGGQVIGVFDRSCYLDLSGRIVALVAPELLNGPLNIVLATLPAGALARISIGDPVRASPHILRLGELYSVDLSKAAIWDARLAPLRRTAGLRSRIDAIKAVLAEAPAESLAHAARRPPRAIEGMDALYSGLRQQHTAALARAAERLIGLGPGLTPSGDDILAGALVATTLLHAPIGRQAREVVLEAARDHTTRISLAYLRAAARGEAGEAWHDLVRALQDPRGDLAAAARRIMAVGETSGADMLTGFVLAGEACLPA